MKRRVISFCLMIVISFTISSISIVQLNAVSAPGYAHDSANDNNCDLLPYAYYAIKYGSYEHFVSHYNLYYGYNSKTLRTSMENGVVSAIYNAMYDTDWTVTAGVGTLKICETIFNSDGELTQQDFYDNILVNMLLDRAVSDVSGANETKSDFSFIKQLLDITITTTNESYNLYTWIKSFPQDEFLEKLGAYLSEHPKNLKDIKIAVDGEEVLIEDGTAFESFLKYISSGKLDVKKINNGFKIIEIIVELADRIEDAINGIQNAFLIWRNVGDDVKPLLNYMRINSNNLFLK